MRDLRCPTLAASLSPGRDPSICAECVVESCAAAAAPISDRAMIVPASPLAANPVRFIASLKIRTRRRSPVDFPPAAGGVPGNPALVTSATVVRMKANRFPSQLGRRRPATYSCQSHCLFESGPVRSRQKPPDQDMRSRGGVTTITEHPLEPSYLRQAVQRRPPGRRTAVPALSSPSGVQFGVRT